MERKLLLVDDEVDITSSLSRLFRGRGYQVLCANSAREGMDLLEKNQIGVVVSDQRMPEMSGTEFLSLVRQKYPETIRMVLSGYADLGAVTDAINRGAVYKFLNKPWENEVLLASVQDGFLHYEQKLEKERLAMEIRNAKQQLEYVNRQLADALENKEREIQFISHFDMLTGLPNRKQYLGQLERILERSRHDSCMTAVIILNIDRFKRINDSYNNYVGDMFLEGVARRLELLIRPGDCVARIGADEFAFVISKINHVHEAAQFVQRLLDSFARAPISLSEADIFVNASMGISIYPPDGLEPTILTRNASAAMAQAKAEGGNCYKFYDTQMNAYTWRRMELETELHRAIESNEFVLYYQPKVNLLNGKIVGMEALLRWCHPERGMVSPGEFIDLLEETGLILPVGEWVLRSACKQAAIWLGEGIKPIRIAVNLSTLQFKQADLSGLVMRICEEEGLGTIRGAIELELTESMVMRNTGEAILTLGRLHAMGISLAIDDFGTGYSSLSYLKNFPIDTLKIDQSFVCGLDEGADDVAIVSAIVALGHSLGMKVVAEGVETYEQLHELKKMGCDEMQGFLFSRPVPVEDMTDQLKRDRQLNLAGRG